MQKKISRRVYNSHTCGNMYSCAREWICQYIFMSTQGCFHMDITVTSAARSWTVYKYVYGKLVDNFSHESDVTSLQDPFTLRPYKTPFYFYYCVPSKIRRGILLKTMNALRLPFPTFQRPAVQFSSCVFSAGFPFKPVEQTLFFTTLTIKKRAGSTRK